MQERPAESNDSSKFNHDPISNSSRHRRYLISTWLDKFDSNKLECYSVLFGISGISLLVLAICLLIIISTTYERHLTETIDCSILNVTHTHVQLCPSRRCRIFNYCIPYICTIIFVHYQYRDLSYESKLLPYNIKSNASCSYEPSSCISRSHIQSEQIEFLKNFVFNHSETTQCCLHSLTQQPMICSNYLNSTQYSVCILLISMGIFIALLLILIGLIIQLHLNNYLKTPPKDKEDFLKTILNFHFSHGTIRSSFDRTTPVNYDLLTQTISQHETPSTTMIHPNDNLLLFDINEERKMFQKECLQCDHPE